MSKRGVGRFLARHGVVRALAKQDLVQFGLPALAVFVAGLVISETRGALGLVATGKAILIGGERPPAWEVVGLMALLLPLFLNRIRLEERLLCEEFGEAYEHYQASTARLIPFLL